MARTPAEGRGGPHELDWYVLKVEAATPEPFVLKIDRYVMQLLGDITSLSNKRNEIVLFFPLLLEYELTENKKQVG